jgi:hypothetical protein
MKSIKEQAENYVSGFHPSIQRMCKESFEESANYVLEQITEAIRICDNDRNTDLYKSLWNCIDELRK